MTNSLNVDTVFGPRVWMIVLGIFWFTPSFSQNYFDLMRIEHTNSPGNDYKSGQGSTDVQEWVVDATVPVPVNPHNSILTGFLFENARLSLYPGEPTVSVTTLNLKLGLSQTYSDKWSANYLLLPKFASDLKQYKKEDFQFGVVALFTYTRNEHLQYKIGALYNTDRFGPLISPLWGLYYQKEKWEINLVLPRLMDLNYHIASSVRLGLRFNGAIKSFNLNEPHNGTPQYLHVSSNELGAYVGWNLGKFNLVGMVGYSVGRKYRTYAQGDQLKLAISFVKIGDDRTQLNTDLKDGLLFKVAAIYRMNKFRK